MYDKCINLCTQVVANNKDEGETEQVKKEGDTAAIGDDITKEGGTLRTAAQKRAEKKEREKERKKKEAAKAKEKKAAGTEQPATPVTTEQSVNKPQTDIGDDKVAETSRDPINGMSFVNCLEFVLILLHFRRHPCYHRKCNYHGG